MKDISLPATDKKWEVVVFYLGKDAFAINVNKTREILRWTGCRPVPHMSPAFVGITTVRGITLPLIDLRRFLNIEPSVPLEQSKVMVVEFNDVRLGFLVDSVERIHRVSSDDLDDSLMDTVPSEWVLYVMKQDARNVLLLDYEAIVQATSPSVADHMYDGGKLESYHAQVGNVEGFHILLADDSPLLRQQVCDLLKQTGFMSVFPVKDGAEAYELLINKGERFDLLITDIEMPRVDGISLIEALRKNKPTAGLPVIVFSSIMVQDLLDQAESLSAVVHILKPDVYSLVETVVDIYQKSSKGEPAAKA